MLFISHTEVLSESILHPTDISSLCSEETILSTNSLNLPLAEVFHGVPVVRRTVGVRFLHPVYLIDRVEITVHHSTSDTTTDRGDFEMNVIVCVRASVRV